MNVFIRVSVIQISLMWPITQPILRNFSALFLIVGFCEFLLKQNDGNIIVIPPINVRNAAI